MSLWTHSKTLILTSVLSLVGFIIIGLSIFTKNALYSHILAIDGVVQVFAAAHASPFLTSIFQFSTALANTGTILLLLILVSIHLAFVHEKDIAALLISGLVFGSALSMYLKNTLLRARPLESIYITVPLSYAFPSAHALIAVVFYGFIGFALMQSISRRWLRIVIALTTILIVFCIGYSRIYLGVHWASDVVGGWLLGAVILTILIYGFRLVQKPRSA